jgi:hypothetical protein
LDYRDWVSYIYAPIIIPLMILSPYFTYKAYQHSSKVNQLIASLAQGSPDLEYMSRLLDGPIKPWTGEQAEEIGEIDEPDLKGFQILQDFEPLAKTAELTRWILMPEGREYKRHRLLRYEKGKPATAEVFKFATEYLATNYSILAFKLLGLEPGYITGLVP